MTAKYRKLFWLFLLVSFVLNVAPLAYYTGAALFGASLIVEKVALSATVCIVLIMSIVSWANKIVLRSRLWIIMLGLYVCLENILVPLLIIAACQVIDELVVCPLKRSFHTKLTIHKELDKRL